MRNRLTIETPESIGFTYQVADVGSRFLAIFVDTLIQFGAIIVLSIALAQLNRLNDLGALPALLPADQFAVVVVIASFLLYVGYFAVFEALWHGQTPGKRLVKLRVVKESGYPLTPIDVLVRNLVRLVDFFPAFYSLGVVTMLLNTRARRLGDLAAGTLVVRTRGEITLDRLVARSAPSAAPAASAGAGPLDPADAAAREAARAASRRLSADDAQMIEAFLARREWLANADALAARLCEAIEAKLDDAVLEAATANMSEADFLALMLRAYRSLAQT
jgi:uncharacterized RDD family membrane protein YckC